MALTDMLTSTSLATADAGYQSEANPKALADRKIDALVADNKMRARDARFASVKFQGAKRDCLPCTHSDKCLRRPDRTKTRQVAIFPGKAAQTGVSHTDRMKRRIDTVRKTAHYMEAALSPWSRCFATCVTTRN